MVSLLLVITAGLTSLGLASTTATSTTSSLPASTDASSYLNNVVNGPIPTWATGAYATSLATALYSVETSFIDRSDYTAIMTALYSAVSKGNAAADLAYLHKSQLPLDITSQGWFTSNVPKALQTEVADYAVAWEKAITSIEAKATATENAAGPRCTGIAVAGVAFGVAAIVGVV